MSGQPLLLFLLLRVTSHNIQSILIVSKLLYSTVSKLRYIVQTMNVE